MSFVNAEVLKEVVGAISSGPAGFGIHYEVAGGANIDQVMNVDIKLNEHSLLNARVNSETGKNKQVAQTLEQTPKASGSIASIAGQQAAVDNRYLSMFSNRGLSASRELPTPSWGGRRPDYRTALSAKNPLLRIRQRRLLQLRKTFDEIACAKKKSVAINPESLPKHVLAKMVEAAISRGDQNTPLGPTPKAAKAVGYNSNAWKRWGHSLIGGSFPLDAPRPRA
jgi:hypothetical protein